MAIALEGKAEPIVKGRRKIRAGLDLLLQYLLALPIGFIFLFPFAWSVLNSLKKSSELLIVPIQWLPKEAQWQNYTQIFTDVPFARSFGNSLVVAASVMVSVIFIGSLAGFALAKYRFRGQSLYLTFILSTMTIPAFVFLMPHFIMVYTLGWINTYWALIVPQSVTAFGVFFMRQFIQGTVPDELLDAARIDGCSELRLFFTVVMPLCRSAYLVLGVVTFIANWNEFLWPLIVTQNKEMYTIPVLLSTLQQAYESMRFMPLLMAGTNIAIIPGMVLFILVQKQIVQGIAVTGLK